MKIKIYTRTIKIASVFALLAFLLLGKKSEAVLAAVYPLLVGVVYLIQCKKTGHDIWKKVWKQTSGYLEATACIMLVWSYTVFRIMNFSSLFQKMLFIGILCLFLFMLSILYLKDSLNRKLVLTLLAAIGAYSVLSVYSWNYAATSGFCNDAIVKVEHRYYSNGYRRAVEYELTVQMPDKTQKVMNVGSSVYGATEEGDHVMLYQYKSAFGLEYYIVYGMGNRTGEINSIYGTKCMEAGKFALVSWGLE